ncbi:hypothetical protein [Rubripirellula reticaptiva]|uniref:hypothetical protein n=1 Tax=Rubripirellula reticaptiva TaxID=2528013 RepID=UPI0016454D82|nr:hypothetical protein [Rubripirellula reticaptiva]
MTEHTPTIRNAVHTHRAKSVRCGKYLLGILSRCDILKVIGGYYRNWTRTRDHKRFPLDLHEITNLRLYYRTACAFPHSGITFSVTYSDGYETV